MLRRVADRSQAGSGLQREWGIRHGHEQCKDLDSRKGLVCEIMTSFKRAGADVVVTYHAREIARNAWLQ